MYLLSVGKNGISSSLTRFELNLTEQSVIPSYDKVQEWWFFCPQMQRIQRSTCLGYWKKTGVDRTIKARDKNREIDTKKTLVFHKGRSSQGIKTNWIVHEYHLLTDNLDELFPHCMQSVSHLFLLVY